MTNSRPAAPSRLRALLLTVGLIAGLALVLAALPPVASAAEEAPAAAEMPSAPDAKAPARPESPEPGYLERRWAGTDLTALAAALGAWRREKGAWPANCPADAAAMLSPAPGLDPWGSAYACALDEPARVLSAGPDRNLGTSDDIAYLLDGGGLIRRGGDSPAASPAAGPGSAAGAWDAAAPAPPPTEEAKTTTDRLVWLARALASFRAREGHHPVAEQGEHLERWLVPADLPPSQWFSTDGWERPWRYRVTDTGSSYSLSSGGADGRWEPLTSIAPAPARNADGDLVVADGVFLRWPAGFRPEGLKASANASAADTKQPADPAARTEWRLERLAALLAKARAQAGRYPESDDAARLFRELSSSIPAVDGWGRDFEYLSHARGAHFALVSRGKDGRQGRSMEDYARGVPASGDDVVMRK